MTALTARQLIDNLKPEGTDMTSPDQPADLDRLRRAHAHYDRTGRDHDAHELAAELPALIAEVERLRAEVDQLRESRDTARADRLQRSLERDRVIDELNDLRAQLAAGTPTA